MISDKNVLLPFAGRESNDWFLNACESGGKPVDILKLPGSFLVAQLSQSAPVTLWTPECSLKGKHLRDSNSWCAFRKQKLSKSLIY